MRFLASIDVKNGECVRLCRGQMADCRVYASSPLEAVRKFNLQCCDLVHIVDLDGAVCGSPQNWRSILEAARQLKSCVQVGGGVRTLADAKLYLEGGASKVVLGTSAIADMEFVCRVSWLYPGRVCVGVDTLGELVATDG